MEKKRRGYLHVPVCCMSQLLDLAHIHIHNTHNIAQGRRGGEGRKEGRPSKTGPPSHSFRRWTYYRRS